MQNTFEEFLKKKWPAEGVLDDEIPDKFEAWLEQLDNSEIMEYAEEYGKELNLNISTLEDAIKLLQ